MAQLKIYGSSDDLIEIEGAIEDEFNPSQEALDDGVFLAISDGTVLKVTYDDDGIWRIGLVSRGEATFSKDENPATDDDRYSDIVVLDGPDFAWVVMGSRIAR